MPRKASKFQPPWLTTHDATRKNAYQRGYCGKKWAATRKQVIVRDCSKCQACGKIVVGKDAQVDHVIPKKRGGTDDLENLCLLCLTCHARKTARGD